MGKFTAFKLPLKSLTKGTHSFDYHLDKQFLWKTPMCATPT